MSTPHPENDGSPARILVAMTGIAIVGLAAILSVIVWLGAAFDRSAQASARALIGSSLNDVASRLAHTTEAFAHRDQLYQAVRYRLSGLVDDAIESLVAETGPFDFVLVTDADGTPRYAYYSDPAWSGTDAFPRTVTRTLIDRLALVEPGSDEAVVGTFRIIERFATFTASPILPSEGRNSGKPPPDILIAGTYLDPLTLPMTRDLLRDQGVKLVLGDIIPQPGRNFVRLSDPTGLTVGALMWIPRRPGTKILRDSAPIVGLGCLVLIVSALLVVKAGRRLQSALRREGRAARTDALTGLANRHGLLRYRQRPAVLAAQRAGTLGVLYMDLNGFKRLNDVEGHAEGDRALQRMSDLLRQSVRTNDFVARVGGDEFLCVVIGEDVREIASTIADRICARTSEPIEIGKRRYVVAPAIGIAIARPGETWEALVERADARMFAAKRAARIDAGDDRRAATAA